MAGSGIESTILKEGPLELYDRGSWVHRHAEICTRSHKHGMDVDKQFLVHRLKPARRELGHVELKSALLSAGDRPDAGERPLAPLAPLPRRAPEPTPARLLGRRALLLDGLRPDGPAVHVGSAERAVAQRVDDRAPRQRAGAGPDQPADRPPPGDRAAGRGAAESESAAVATKEGAKARLAEEEEGEEGREAG